MSRPRANDRRHHAYIVVRGRRLATLHGDEVQELRERAHAQACRMGLHRAVVEIDR
ncbi:hypothetical protein HOP51_08630 [Halomonas sp. MCCC 1A11036]|uniref:Uncharacterized protein n=1 Tax=Billgrantia zhangzhouensis TaxID=2733481 RepID=A0ABS9AEN9_9GAMM|nr:hypothetical protein [Halomonas zhangzhouensis]MCE8020179.1 hypothetical protein [Halomonas zhangzhouensis]